MAKETENTAPRLYLFRLIPDASTSQFHNEKREELLRRRQKELLVRQLVDKFSDSLTAVVCDDVEQGASLCPCVYGAGYSVSNRSLLLKFLAGDVRQMAFFELPDADFLPTTPTYVFIISAKTAGDELAECLRRLLANTNVTVFLLFHIMSSDEWRFSSAIDSVDPSLLAMYDIPVKDDSDPERPESEDDYDRVKVYNLPYKGGDATFKFMWNDGYKGVYYKVQSDGEVAEEGYRYDTTLLELLNKEFNKQKPSKKLSTHISDVFDSQDFEVIASL